MSAGSTPRCSTRPATRRSRRAGRRSSSTPTATASATRYVEPNQPVDPTKDKRIVAGLYGIAVNPADGRSGARCWLSRARIVRLDPGRNPPETALAEYLRAAVARATAPRGMDIDRNGIVWVLARERPLGKLRPPQVQGSAQRPDRDRPALPGRLDALSASRPAVRERDRRRQRGGELLHLGRPVRHLRARARTCRSPPATSTIRWMALVDGKWVTLRVPYPMGFFAKGLDGRIDDPNAGWKGKGLWATYRPRAVPHRRRQGQRPKVVKFQLRPDPLAR